MRFDELAQSIAQRVDDPSQAGVDRYVGLEHLDSGELRISRWGSPGDVEATKLRFRPGDVIFGRRRAYQRKVAQADFEGICSAHALVLRARKEHMLPEFLPLFMQSDQFFERALAISVGSLSPTINWKTLAAERFLVPSLNEQRGISERVRAVDESRVAWKRAKHAVGVTKLSLIEESIRDADRMPLKEVCATDDGPRKPVEKSKRLPGANPYCGANGVQDYVAGHTHRGPAVLVAEDAGYWGPREPSAYVMDGDYWVNNHAHVLRVSDGWSPALVADLLCFADLRSHISGSTRGKLTKASLESIALPAPPNRAWLTRQLNELDEAAGSIQRHVDALTTVRSSLLVPASTQ